MLPSPTVCSENSEALSHQGDEIVINAFKHRCTSTSQGDSSNPPRVTKFCKLHKKASEMGTANSEHVQLLLALAEMYEAS